MESKSLNQLRDEIDDWAQEKGWNDGGRTVGDFIALMHTELSEALEEYRNGHTTREIYNSPNTLNKPKGVPIELADCIIRILHFCAVSGIDIDDAVHRKMVYNGTRPYRHGGKVI